MRGLLGKILVGVLLVIMVLEIGALGFMGFKIVRGESPRQLAEKGKTDGQPPASDGADNADSSDSGSLNDVVFEKHAVTSGIGDNYLFDIAVGYTTKDVMNSVSSDDLTAFLSGIDFTETSGNAVLMFEDGTGLSIMDISRTYTADYGYIDVSEGEFTMVDRLGAIWNDTGEGWYYKTVAEMRAADNAGESNPDDSNEGDTLTWLIEADVSRKYDGYSIEYNASDITVSVWKESITNTANLVRNGTMDADDWTWMKNHTKNSADYIYDCILHSEYSDKTLIFNVFDDENNGTLLFTITNTDITSDAILGQ